MNIIIGHLYHHGGLNDGMTSRDYGARASSNIMPCHPGFEHLVRRHIPGAEVEVEGCPMSNWFNTNVT